MVVGHYVQGGYTPGAGRTKRSGEKSRVQGRGVRVHVYGVAGTRVCGLLTSKRKKERRKERKNKEDRGTERASEPRREIEEDSRSKRWRTGSRRTRRSRDGKGEEEP